MIRCRPPNGRRPRAAEVAQCKRWLWAEIKTLRPKAIVPFGRDASRVLLGGRADFRLEDVAHKAHKVEWLDGVIVPMPDPPRLLKGPKAGVEEAVRTFVKIRNYLGGETPPRGDRP